MNEYGRRVTLTTAPTAGCAAWKSASARSMFFLPMKPCGHCVHVTKSASTRRVAARGATVRFATAVCFAAAIVAFVVTAADAAAAEVLTTSNKKCTLPARAFAVMFAGLAVAARASAIAGSN